VDGIDPHH